MSKILVIAEHDCGRLRLASLSAGGFAAKLCAATGGSFDMLVLGEKVGEVAEAVRRYGAARVLVADHPQLREPLADRYAQVIAETTTREKATLVVAAASTFSKDILPRSAALLQAGMLSDLVDAWPDGDDFTFKRLMFAGNVIATVKLDGAPKVLTVRPAAFPPLAEVATVSPLLPVPVEAELLPGQIEFVAREEKGIGRPDATEARVVVSGGRAFRSVEDFERLVGGLADALGGAVGSSRALVDSGITPNSLQIGQTGKIVAPELYWALGISGTIQHLAGMKDTKIVVAINKDPEAPIFEAADYGLVADVYQAVPELIERLRPS